MTRRGPSQRALTMTPQERVIAGDATINGDGYRMLYLPFHPSIKSTPYIAEHRVIAERQIGRLLDGHREVVHHKNGDKLDNRPENLKVMPLSEHARMHGRERGQRGEA